MNTTDLERKSARTTKIALWITVLLVAGGWALYELTKGMGQLMMQI